MTQPSGEQVAVATAALRTEAGQWDVQSTAIAAVATKVAAMELGRVEAGLFQLIVAPYNDVVAAVQDRCREAATAMTAVGSTLRSVADAYDEEDRRGEHRLRQIY